MTREEIENHYTGIISHWRETIEVAVTIPDTEKRNELVSELHEFWMMATNLKFELLKQHGFDSMIHH